MFRVSAVNATGVGLPSPLSNVVVPCTVPGAPSRLTAMPGTGSATLTWAAPTTNGGAPIINYVVQHSVDGGRSWVTVNRPASTATTATVPGLARGATYVFRVSAVNAAGIGTASPVSNVITIRA